MANINNFNPHSGGNDEDNGNNGFGGGTFIIKGPAGRPSDSFDEIDPEELLINYNEKFVNEKPIPYRDNIIYQTLSCLIGKFSPNALLIGPTGVGKTKIVEEIARRIANNDPLIPDQLKNRTIWELPISNIVAGSKFVGDVEAKIKAVIKFASDPDNKAILFIDEMHMLMSEQKQYSDISQIMKPALRSGAIRVIGATTLQESQMLMKDPAFNNRFTTLIVDELSQEQTVEILKQMQLMLYTHYESKVIVNDRTIEEVVKIADEFKTMGSHRPNSAITLLDRTMADALIRRKIKEEEAKNDPALAMLLQQTPNISITKSQLRKTAMKIMTGNNEKSEFDSKSLRGALSVIKGQDNVIEYLIDALARDSLGIYPREKPLTLLFAGNSGVGKTEIVKIIAKELTNTKPIILNMTEFHSSASINRIIGSPAGYVGSDSNAELPFDIMKSNPYQVILLDEFEKCDKSVQRLFMSAFDEGCIKTNRGATVDFSRAIIIATTNAGHTTKSDPIGFTADTVNSTEASIKDLSHAFDLELLNRFTKVLNFNPITETLFKDIMKDVYERDIKRIKETRSSASFLADELTDEELETLVKDNYAKEFGARPVKRAVQKYIEDAMLDKKNYMLTHQKPVQAADDDEDADNEIEPCA